MTEWLVYEKIAPEMDEEMDELKASFKSQDDATDYIAWLKSRDQRKEYFIKNIKEL